MVARAELQTAEAQVYAIPVELIDVPSNRARTLKPAQALAIGEAIKADRQYDPITVAQLPGSDRFTLVDGLHRLHGSILVGLSTIEARFTVPNATARRWHEVISGWARADHDVFDRAQQVKVMADLARAKSDDAGEAFQSIGTALRWDLATAEALGIKKSTVRNYTTLATVFASAEITALRSAGLAEELVPLLLLAKQAVEIRSAVIELLQAGWRGTITEAIARVAGLPKPDSQLKFHATIKSTFARLQEARRVDIVAELMREQPRIFDLARQQNERLQVNDEAKPRS